MYNPFKRSKNKAKILQEKENRVDNSIVQTLELQKDNLDVLKNIEESGRTLNRNSEEWKKLVLEEKAIRKALLEREEKLRQSENDLAERQKKFRQDEITMTAKKADIRNQESVVNSRDEGLEDERKSIKKREKEARELHSDSLKIKEQYETKSKRLETEKADIEDIKEVAERRDKESKLREQESVEIHQQAKEIDANLEKRKSEFEESHKEIEQKLEEKIDEYEQRIKDISELKNTADSMRFDTSEEGKQAKIVVQEAIRQAKKKLQDGATEFEGLQEKYCEGTFKGFAIPLDQIDDDFDILKEQVEQVKKHAAESDLLEDVQVWIKYLDECLLKSERAKKSWEFAEAYRHIIHGLATGKNYELLLQVLNAQSGGPSDDNDSDDADTEPVPDYYEILEVSVDATKKDIKTAYKKLAHKYHPDKNKNSKECEEKMKDINKAYNILKNEKKRAEYDKRRQSN